MKISRKTREAVATIATYHDTKGSFVSKLTDVLDAAGLEVDEFINMPGDDGRTRLLIAGYDNVVFCSLYRMPSGRYEFTAYIS